MKGILTGLRAGQKGQVFPLVLVLMVVGALIALPALNHVQTSLKTGEVVEENFRALYAADAGVEDALWRLKYTSWPSFPYTYTLKDASGNPRIINGMTVQVTIDYVPALGGEDTPKIGVHEDWLQIEKSVTWDEASGYTFTLVLTSWYTPSNIKIERIVLDFPSTAPYVVSYTGPTSGDMTSQGPNVSGDWEAGMMLIWELDPPYTIQKYDPHAEPITATLTFRLSGPSPSVLGGLGFYTSVTATREDIGTITDSWPLVISSVAADQNGEQAAIRAGVWHSLGGAISIRNWIINQ